MVKEILFLCCALVFLIQEGQPMHLGYKSEKTSALSKPKRELELFDNDVATTGVSNTDVKKEDPVSVTSLNEAITSLQKLQEKIKGLQKRIETTLEESSHYMGTTSTVAPLSKEVETFHKEPAHTKTSTHRFSKPF